MKTLLSLVLFLCLLPLGAQDPEIQAPEPETAANVEPNDDAPEDASEDAAAENSEKAAPVDPEEIVRVDSEPYEWPENPRIMLIPIRQSIMPPQLFQMRRGVNRALEEEVDAIVLIVDSPGGRVDIMQKNVNLIIDTGIPTFTLVENGDYGAISAAAIISLATDRIYMQPRSKIGDAMPIVQGQELGDNQREKIETYMDALVRTVAQAKGRDEMMIRAMVRRTLEYKLEDGRVISEAGQILTMTNVEAAELKPDGTPILSEATVTDLDAMLAELGLENAEQIQEESTWADQIALWITRLSPLLMMGALAFFYLEVNSPGIGWMGGLAVLLFSVVMFGHNVAGLAGYEDILIVILGMVLILVEILVTPGFGLLGGSGIVLLIGGLLNAMISRYPGNPGDLEGLVNFDNVGMAVTNVSLALIGSVGLFAVFLKQLDEQGVFGRRLVLATQLSGASPDTLPEQAEEQSLVGEQGLSLTPLSPSGTVRIHGKDLDAMSDGTYIEAKAQVTVQAERGGRIIVSLTESPS